MSREYLLHAAPRPLVIGAAGMAEIEQNIRLIIATRSFGVRLDCAFAGEGAYVDSPLPHASARRMAEIIEVVERYEPRVRVLSVDFQPDPDAALQGRLFPLLRFAVQEEAL